MTSRDVKLSISEAKQQLRSLRSIINSEVADLPKWSNILRESILDQIIEHKIISIEKFRAALDKRSYDKTDERQFQYFEKIADIVKRL